MQLNYLFFFQNQCIYVYICFYTYDFYLHRLGLYIGDIAAHTMNQITKANIINIQGVKAVINLAWASSKSYSIWSASSNNALDNDQDFSPVSIIVNKFWDQISPIIVWASNIEK